MNYERKPVRTGNMTLLLLVVAICISVLAVLTLVSAKANSKLAEKQIYTAQKVAETDALGNKWLAQLDAALAEDSKLPDGTVTNDDGTLTAAIEGENGRTLHITVKPTDDGANRYKIIKWQQSVEWDVENGEQLWTGM